MKNSSNVSKNKLLADLVLAAISLVLIVISVMTDYLYFDEMKYISVALYLAVIGVMFIRKVFTRQKNLKRSPITDIITAVAILALAALYVMWQIKNVGEMPSFSRSRSFMAGLVLGFYVIIDFVDIFVKYIMLSLGVSVVKEKHIYHKSK